VAPPYPPPWSNFALPVSFRTSAHMIFCWAFQWGQFLRRCSRVWVRYGHRQHLAVGLIFVHLRYWPVRQWLGFNW